MLNFEEEPWKTHIEENVVGPVWINKGETIKIHVVAYKIDVEEEKSQVYVGTKLYTVRDQEIYTKTGRKPLMAETKLNSNTLIGSLLRDGVVELMNIEKEVQNDYWYIVRIYRWNATDNEFSEFDLKPIISEEGWRDKGTIAFTSDEEGNVEYEKDFKDEPFAERLQKFYDKGVLAFVDTGDEEKVDIPLQEDVEYN